MHERRETAESGLLLSLCRVLSLSARCTHVQATAPQCRTLSLSPVKLQVQQLAYIMCMQYVVCGDVYAPLLCALVMRTSAAVPQCVQVCLVGYVPCPWMMVG